MTKVTQSVTHALNEIDSYKQKASAGIDRLADELVQWRTQTSTLRKLQERHMHTAVTETVRTIPFEKWLSALRSQPQSQASVIAKTWDSTQEKIRVLQTYPAKIKELHTSKAALSTEYKQAVITQIQNIERQKALVAKAQKLSTTYNDDYIKTHEKLWQLASVRSFLFKLPSPLEMDYTVDVTPWHMLVSPTLKSFVGDSMQYKQATGHTLVEAYAEHNTRIQNINSAQLGLAIAEQDANVITQQYTKNEQDYNNTIQELEHSARSAPSETEALHKFYEDLTAFLSTFHEKEWVSLGTGSETIALPALPKNVWEHKQCLTGQIECTEKIMGGLTQQVYTLNKNLVPFDKTMAALKKQKSKSSSAKVKFDTEPFHKVATQMEDAGKTLSTNFKQTRLKLKSAPLNDNTLGLRQSYANNRSSLSNSPQTNIYPQHNTSDQSNDFWTMYWWYYMISSDSHSSTPSLENVAPAQLEQFKSSYEDFDTLRISGLSDTTGMESPIDSMLESLSTNAWQLDSLSTDIQSVADSSSSWSSSDSSSSWSSSSSDSSSSSSSWSSSSSDSYSSSDSSSSYSSSD